MDYTCRVGADMLKVNYLRERRVTESRIYFALVWGMIVVGILIILTVTSQPLVLLIISSCVGGFMMFLYSGLLILTNKRLLPESIRIGGVRLAAMIWSIAFFGVFSAIAIWDQWDNVQKLFGGG